MTPAQLQLYRSAWQAAAVAHGWNTKAGRSAAVASYCAMEVWVSPELNQVHSCVISLAQIRAQSDNDRDIAADDFRHGVTAAVLGRFKSSKAFSNSDLDKVLALLRLLANPEDLRNLNAFADDEAGERRRHIHVITAVAEPYWHKLAADKFGHTDLDRLTLAQLRQLSLTIRNRRPAARVGSIPQLTTV